MSLDDVAKLRGLSPSTIASHIERLIRDGCELDLDRLVDPSKRGLIEDFFRMKNDWSLNEAVEHFSGTVSFEEARITRAYLLRRREAGEA